MGKNSTDRLEVQIRQVIHSAVSQAIAAFRDNILAEVSRSLGTTSARAANGRAAASGSKRAWPTCSVSGCGKKFFGPSGSSRLCYEHYVKAGGQHPARAAAAPSRGAKAARSAKGPRRGKDAGAVVDQLLAFIAKNPGLRSEQIQKQIGVKQALVKAGLAKLRAAGKVKTTGSRRSTTYASA